MALSVCDDVDVTETNLDTSSQDRAHDHVVTARKPDIANCHRGVCKPQNQSRAAFPTKRLPSSAAAAVVAAAITTERTLVIIRFYRLPRKRTANAQMLWEFRVSSHRRVRTIGCVVQSTGTGRADLPGSAADQRHFLLRPGRSHVMLELGGPLWSRTSRLRLVMVTVLATSGRRRHGVRRPRFRRCTARSGVRRRRGSVARGRRRRGLRRRVRTSRRDGR